MTAGKTLRTDNNEKGFTLIEVIVALALSCLVGGSITMSIFQVLDVNARSTTHMTVLDDVERAVHLITLDAQMAQLMSIVPPSGFPLTLTWVEWDGTSNNVTYSIQEGKLLRNYSRNGGTLVSTVVAHHIDSEPQMTNVQYSGGTLVFRITTTVGGFRPGSESRSFKVFPRAVLQ